jgi:hypothetical protein
MARTSGGRGGGGGGFGAGDFPGVFADVIVAGTLNVDLDDDTLYLLTSASSLIGAVSGVMTAGPTLVAPLGDVITSEALFVAGVDTTTDRLDLAATITVTDSLGTNVLTVVATGYIPQAGAGQNGSIDWSTAVATQVIGTDLAWDGTSKVTSTAGGIFTVVMVYSLAWD